MQRCLEPGDEREQTENDEQSGPTGCGAPRRGDGGYAHSGVWRDRWAVNGVLVSGEGKIGENGRPEQIPTGVLYSGPWRAPNSISKPPSCPRATNRKPSSELSAGLARGDRFQTLLGVTGSGKTMTMANVIKAARPADVGPLAQQDARRATLRGDQELLPAQRRRVLHLVLRLLPARSLRPDDRHVHRKRRVDQRGHRSPAAPRDIEPDGARRRHHRRYGVGNLWPRRSGVIPRADGHAHERRAHRARRHSAVARARAVLAERRRLRARDVPRARRYGRDLSGL